VSFASCSNEKKKKKKKKKKNQKKKSKKEEEEEEEEREREKGNARNYIFIPQLSHNANQPLHQSLLKKIKEKI
jgi:sortase (surface protein transpeptidase)